MKKTVLISLIFIVSFSLPVLSLSVTVQPPSFDITANPAGVRTFILEVENVDPKNQVKVKIYLETLKIGPEGELTFLSLSDDPQGPGSWIKTNNTSIILGPMDKKRIPLRLLIPAKTESGGYYAAVIAEPDTQEKPVGKGLQVAFRLASIVRISVMGSRPLVRKASISDFFYLRGPIDPKTLNEAEEKGALGVIAKEYPNTEGLFFAALMKNEGNIHFKTFGSVLVQSEDKRRKGEVDFVSGTGIIYPGSGRFFVAHFPYSLSEGDYLAKLRFRQTGLSTITKDFPFSIKISRDLENNTDDAFLPLLITPGSIELSASRGAFRTKKFSVYNRLKEDVNLNISFDGQTGEWIESNTDSITIPSGRSKDVILQFNIPRNLGEDDFSGIIRLRDQQNGIDQEIKVDILIEGANREW
ncbi:MAG: hypothetical protein JW867_00885 [Candidatus Omnitrophica bacterium]|nr:hypothetical protein [Candidatus Omnitrophota bacterium]